MSRVRADFNGLFGDLLCLSHTDDCVDETGTRVSLREGLQVTAYDDDFNARGERDDLIATGTVERSPAWLNCRGSKWVLRLDHLGVQHEPDLPPQSA